MGALRSAGLVAASLLLLAASALAQEPDARPDRFDRSRQLQQRGIALDDTIPGDTLGVSADTLPRVDIEARRQGLETEGYPARDDIFRQLKDLPGFMVFEYRGQEVRLGVEEQRIGLLGDAQVNRGPDVLTADTILYRGNVRFMSAIGNIELVGADQKDVQSDSLLYYDLASLKGTVFGAETQFAQGATTWRVVGDVIPKAQDTVFASSGAFTSCDVENPHYRFQAGEIKLVNRDVIVAWPVVLYVSQVPVFWLPFFAQDIRPGRRSGLLPPRFGFNDVVQTSGSTSRNVTDFGYYWAINDFTDLAASVDWFSGNYTRLNGIYRYRFLKKFIRGSVAYGQTFSESGRNLTLGLNHDQELGLATTLRVSARYVQDTRTFQDQSFDPALQTQTIDSDAGLNHRFSFANVSVSARRRQFLTSEKIDLTLPRFSLSFSPVTLFAAPRSREGLFNNMTLSGSGNFSRQSTSEPLTTDRDNTNASFSGGLRLKQLNFSGGARYNEIRTVDEDSTGVELPAETVRQMDWNAGIDYQVNLVGSTTLRPNIRWNGGYFRSEDTGSFVSVPVQMAVGATLSTDVFGFYPGFGPFNRVRHKFSPGFSWAYAPAVGVDSATASIPGFPVDSIRARNTLSFTLRQTFEAKVRGRAESRSGSPGPGTDLPPELGGAQQRLEAVAAGDSLPADSLMEVDLTGPPTMPPRDRVVTLLALNSSALVFDFERAKLGEPALISPTISNNITSDLLRGLTVNMTHRLFEGTGADRKFKLSLQQIALGFSLRSGTSLGDLVGLGGGERRSPAERASGRPAVEPEPEPDARSGLTGFYDADRTDPFADGGGGPWTLSVRYSLVRPQTEGGLESQTLAGTLAFHPTPGWAVRWSTQYNITTGDFGQQLITLDRDLHRWRASFQFARAPNGNVIFSVGVHLTDAPDLRGDYRQQTN